MNTTKKLEMWTCPYQATPRVYDLEDETYSAYRLGVHPCTARFPASKEKAIQLHLLKFHREIHARTLEAVKKKLLGKENWRDWAYGYMKNFVLTGRSPFQLVSFHPNLVPTSPQPAQQTNSPSGTSSTDHDLTNLWDSVNKA